jgi:hypothetical protein
MTMPTNDEVVAKGAAVAERAGQKLAEEAAAVARMPLLHLNALYVLNPAHSLAVAQRIGTSIVPQFEWFLRPDPVALEAMETALRIVSGPYSEPRADPTLGNLIIIPGMIEGWIGQAASVFKENFVADLPGIRANQLALAEELAIAVRAMHTVVITSRQKVQEIGDRTIEALDALPSGGDSGSVLLTIMAALLPVLGIPGTSALGLAIVGGGLSVGAQLTSEAAQSRQVVLEGGTVEAVLNSMDRAIADLKTEIAEAERIIGQVLAFDLDVLEGQWARARDGLASDLVPRRPSVIDRLSGSDVDFEYTGPRG